MGPHGNLLNPREHRIFDFQKNVSGKKEEEEQRKKNKEGFRVASGDKLTEATKNPCSGVFLLFVVINVVVSQ